MSTFRGTIGQIWILSPKELENLGIYYTDFGLTKNTSMMFFVSVDNEGWGGFYASLDCKIGDTQTFLFLEEPYTQNQGWEKLRQAYLSKTLPRMQSDPPKEPIKPFNRWELDD